MNEDIRDQLELCKTGLRRSMGHLARIEQLLNKEEALSRMSEEVKEQEFDYTNR
jgi:predicted component of type VI protein secretion system